ncbi:uncharacterized protein LOC124119755 [Haliotis rufescens]|uniref:uncharacterized protein LOC124119755 n=1 Tax=Haliotis rufescens TaxID=6454 RepID=UPI00201ED25B|nr:uncharacterized protein LOC124119755 [Haliotis rufescens]
MAINMLRVLIVIAAVSALNLVVAQSQQQCQTVFLTQFYQCIQNVTLNPQHLLYFTRNGTVGTQPPDMAVFQDQACGHQTNIFNCSLRVRDTLLNNSACPLAEKSSITNFFGSIFQPYDILCAHPCRFSLVDKLRGCYSESDLDADLFMPNNSRPGGNMMGDTLVEVDAFCKMRNPLVQCMKREQRVCPESPIVMRNIGLDLDSLDKTVNVLCLHPKVYLDSLECFSSPTRDVQMCMQSQNQKVVELGLTAEQQKMPQNEFLVNFCRIRLEHVKCDLDAWRKHTLDTCNPAVIGMKTELDCKLMPAECKTALGDQYQMVCADDKFNTQHRDNYGNGTTRCTTSSILYIVLTWITLSSLINLV